MSLTAVHDGDLSRAVAPTPAARRQRRHRARRKQGRFVVQVGLECPQGQDAASADVVGARTSEAA